MAYFKRAKDIISESLQSINEAQIMDATPQFQQFMEQCPSAQQSVGNALGEVSGIAAMAKQALDAISAASQTAQATGVEQNAIIDNINAAQEVDPSQSVITLTDHRSGVQQAYNILNTIVSALNTANGLCGKLNMLVSRQFL